MSAINKLKQRAAQNAGKEAPKPVEIHNNFAQKPKKVGEEIKKNQKYLKNMSMDALCGGKLDLVTPSKDMIAAPEKK